LPQALTLGRPSREPSNAIVSVHAPGVALALPEVVAQAAEDAAYRTLEFFTSQRLHFTRRSRLFATDNT
jgi:hypothetical protein